MPDIPTCDCRWIYSPHHDKLVHPKMKRFYFIKRENGKRNFRPAGWICVFCEKLILEDNEYTHFKTGQKKKYPKHLKTWDRMEI